jgi:hypothetical protein
MNRELCGENYNTFGQAVNFTDPARRFRRISDREKSPSHFLYIVYIVTPLAITGETTVCRSLSKSCHSTYCGKRSARVPTWRVCVVLGSKGSSTDSSPVAGRGATGPRYASGFFEPAALHLPGYPLLVFCNGCNLRLATKDDSDRLLTPSRVPSPSVKTTR